MNIKQEIQKWKNFVILSLALALFFVLSYFHDWANDFFIKLHFCNHSYCMLFSVIFFGFAYFAYKNKKSYLKRFLIVLIIGIILMNITICTNGEISLKENLFTTYPETNECSDICHEWDIGSLTKVSNECLSNGDLFVRDGKETLISKSLYIPPCCCYNLDTCEDLGYISRIPEADFSSYEEIIIRDKLICWKEKEAGIICCQMFNLDKEGNKMDIVYELMTNEECNGKLDSYDGVNVVDGGFCK